jgi:hypothetical protein
MAETLKDDGTSEKCDSLPQYSHAVYLYDPER